MPTRLLLQEDPRSGHAHPHVTERVQLWCEAPEGSDRAHRFWIVLRTTLDTRPDYGVVQHLAEFDNLAMADTYYWEVVHD